MNPTSEQLEALRLFATGDSLAIEAGAGTGKTSTLVLLAESAGKRRGQYIAFNKALVEDGKGKFPDTVSANTAHSLAYRALGFRFRNRLGGARMTGREISARLRLDALEVHDFYGKPKTLAPAYLAGLCSKAVRSFCQSADQTIAEWHFQYIEGLDPADDQGKRGWEVNRYVRNELLPFARTMWEDLQLERGWVPYTHDHYLKAWQLSGPRMDVDYVMFDEAQDANPVIAAIVADQAQHGSQLVYVGDSQQEIYSFTGAVNALAQVKTDHRTYLTQSFRFGQPIADEANRILDELQAPLRLTGNPGIDSTVGTIELPRAILTRTNATGIRRLLNFLMDETAVHLIGGAADTVAFCNAALELMEKGHTSHPELAVFGSWLEVQNYVDMEAEGEDLRLMVRLIDEFTPQAIITGLNDMAREDKAEVVISTAHKSKGRQWQSVQLASDFKRPKDKETDPERRLLYVAVTRAQEELDIDALHDDETLSVKEALLLKLGDRGPVPDEAPA